jgi:hypothetical protein
LRYIVFNQQQLRNTHIKYSASKEYSRTKYKASNFALYRIQPVGNIRYQNNSNPDHGYQIVTFQGVVVSVPLLSTLPVSLLLALPTGFGLFCALFTLAWSPCGKGGAGGKGQKERTYNRLNSGQTDLQRMSNDRRKWLDL